MFSLEMHKMIKLRLTFLLRYKFLSIAIGMPKLSIMDALRLKYYSSPGRQGGVKNKLRQ